ncbi:hypothetical protein BKA65DRAFT_519269 [Rhexocercosporidium sp. MPI-PUGE-AT-0058]|nr:hypothetical protein BKA65DRAFT_519269 [Rhexocercosporidium sp. MPI-PUGE-AT-0058]
MSSPSTIPEPYQPPESTQNESMTWEELRKKYPQLPEQIPRPTRSVECNSMGYTDDKGVERQIWIPKGTLQAACKHFDMKNWNALAKWPTYVDQGYADEGEAEEKEEKTWEWLVKDSADAPKEPEVKDPETKGA